eukprot:scaffold271204_cov32-Prasinocladus_malaysianus.AAC.1
MNTDFKSISLYEAGVLAYIHILYNANQLGRQTSLLTNCTGTSSQNIKFHSNKDFTGRRN